MMTIYVGYIIIGDYSHALFMSTDRKQVKEALDSIKSNRSTYITGYIIKGNELIEFDWE